MLDAIVYKALKKGRKVTYQGQEVVSLTERGFATLKNGEQTYLYRYFEVKISGKDLIDYWTLKGNEP